MPIPCRYGKTQRTFTVEGPEECYLDRNPAPIGKFERVGQQIVENLPKSYRISSKRAGTPCLNTTD